MASKKALRERREIEALLDQEEAERGPVRHVGALHGKVAVVTGASRGIGLAIATALAAERCDLAILARDTRPLKVAAPALARTAQVRVVVKSCDVRSPAAVEAFFRAFRKRFKRLDILINNAGISHAVANVDQLSPDKWREVLDTNLTGMFLVTHFALPLMPPGSSIVNNLSIAAREVFPGEAAYIASKHGALGLTNTLREELRPRRIRVLALLPGATDTAIWEQFMPEAPRQRMMSPDAVAQAVLHALTLPENGAIEEIRLGPVGGPF